MSTYRRTILALLVAPAILTAQSSAPKAMPAPQYSVTALAPVMIVDAVEPSLEFWTTKLGFAKENAVPGPDGKLVFASVKKDGVEIMYQTRASVVTDDPSVGTEVKGRTAALFIMLPSMRDLDVVERAVKGAPMMKPRHETFYGTTEFYIREPGGNVVGFSARK
jgi:uncharacterized glyoxalase superfamily protein PhnB